MKRPDFDVIVVGAGAGGAAAACYLVQAGLRVLVVEKERLPRYKACGGAVPRPALDRFPFDFGGVILAEPDGVRFTFPGRPKVDLPLPDRPVVMVKRSEFDAFLLAHSGAEVLEGKAVTGVSEAQDYVEVEAGGRRLTTRYLVGADGALSVVARCLGLRRTRRLGGALEAEVPLAGRDILRQEYGSRALFCLGVLPWGYAWVFPKADCLSVGVAHFRPGRADLRAVLHAEMARLGIPLVGVEIHGHPLPYYQAPEKLSTRRCLLVGDAAGLEDPFMGEGIRYAMASARLAAQLIVRDDLAGYEAAIWQEIGRSLAAAGRVASLFYRLPRLSYRLGVRNPATIRHFVAVLTEKTSYVGLGRRLFVATIRWLFRY